MSKENGTTAICYRFDNSLGGDLPEVTMDASNIIVDNDDGSGTFRLKENTDGGLMIVAPGGDFFRMITTEPTVTVTVNGFLARYCFSVFLSIDKYQTFFIAVEQVTAHFPVMLVLLQNSLL